MFPWGDSSHTLNSDDLCSALLSGRRMIADALADHRLGERGDIRQQALGRIGLVDADNAVGPSLAVLVFQ